MTPVLSAVYDELLALANGPSHADHARRLREAFFARTGRFDADHPESGARDAAAWEDALVRGGLARALAAELGDAAEREVALSLDHAHRGLYVFGRVDDSVIARDLWSGAQLVVLAKDDIARELAVSESDKDRPLCQARLLPTTDGCAVLPGAVFHPADARAALAETLAAAHTRRLATDDLMDALLKMEHTWRSLSRVKVGYAYRPDALPR